MGRRRGGVVGRVPLNPRGGVIQNAEDRRNGGEQRLQDGEDGIIVFGGGNGCAGRGCLFWVLVSLVLSVGLTVLVNLLLVLL